MSNLARIGGVPVAPSVDSLRVALPHARVNRNLMNPQRPRKVCPVECCPVEKTGKSFTVQLKVEIEPENDLTTDGGPYVNFDIEYKDDNNGSSAYTGAVVVAFREQGQRKDTTLRLHTMTFTENVSLSADKTRAIKYEVGRFTRICNRYVQRELNDLLEILKTELKLAHQIPDGFTCRLTDSIRRKHKVGNCGAIFLAPHNIIKDLVDAYEPRRNYSDAADALVAVPLNVFRKDDETVSAFLRQELSLETARLTFQLKSGIKRLCDSDPKKDQSYSVLAKQGQKYSVLITKNGDSFGLPGGKRQLGETPLQCAEREASEEAGIDFRHWIPVSFLEWLWPMEMQGFDFVLYVSNDN